MNHYAWKIAAFSRCKPYRRFEGDLFSKWKLVDCLINVNIYCKSRSRLLTISEPPKGAKSKNKYSRIIAHGSMYTAWNLTICSLLTPWSIFHRSTVPPFHHSTVLPFHRSTIPPFYHSTVLPFHRSTIPPFHHSTVPPFYRSTVLPFYRSTVLPFHRCTVPPFHRSTFLPFHHSTFYHHSTIPVFRVARKIMDIKVLKATK